MIQPLVEAVISGLMVGLIYSLIGVGIVLIYKASKVFSLAQGELMLLGSYLCYAFLSQAGIPSVAAIVATLVTAAVIGLIVNRVFIAPLIGQPVVPVIMITIMIGLLLRVVTSGIWEASAKPLGLPVGESIHLGSITIAEHYIYVLILSIVVFGSLAFFFRTKYGLALRATADAHEVARSTGVKVTSVFDLVWALAGLLGAIVGILMARTQGVNYGLYLVGYKALPVVVLGGLDSVSGVLIAGPIVGIIEYLSIYYLDQAVGGGAGEVAPYVILLLVLLIKPYGLMGLRSIERI